MNFIQFLNSLSITTKVTDKRLRSINAMKSTHQAFAKYLTRKDLTEEDYNHVFKYISDHDLLEVKVHDRTFNTILTTHKFYKKMPPKDKLFNNSSDEEDYQQKTFPGSKKKSKKDDNKEESPSSSSKQKKKSFSISSSAEELFGSFSEYFKKFKNTFDFSKTSEEFFFNEDAPGNDDDESSLFRSRYKSWRRLYEADLSETYPIMIVNGNELTSSQIKEELKVFDSLYHYDPDVLPSRRKQQLIKRIDNHASSFMLDYNNAEHDELEKSLKGQLWRVRQLDLVKPLAQKDELDKIFMGEEATLSRICAIMRIVKIRDYQIIDGILLNNE